MGQHTFRRDGIGKKGSKLTADFRRLTQMRNRTFHRRGAEYAEEIPFAQSGDDDWAKTYSSNLSNVFVCRRLPTNKYLILCALCGSTLLTTLSPSKGASAVIFLKGFLSVSICGVNPLRAWRLGAKNYAAILFKPVGNSGIVNRSPCKKPEKKLGSINGSGRRVSSRLAPWPLRPYQEARYI